MGQYGSPYLLGKVRDTGFPDWAPVFGTVGQTVTVYSMVGGIVATLTVVCLALGVGYHVGRRVDVEREYRRVGGATVAGCVLATTLVYAAWTLVTTTLTFDAFTVFVVLGSFGRMLVGVGLVVTLGVVAGAALGHFESDENPPASPTAVDTGRDSQAPSEAPDSGSQRSQPTR